MKVVIIKYNSGNTQSVSFALDRAGVTAIISDDAEIIKSADKVIFPGVGNAATAMNYLKENKLDNLIRELKQPVLGICLGMQLMCSFSEEGNTVCLGIFNETVKQFKKLNTLENIKIPQMGWNNIFELKSPLFTKISEKEYMYFVHGFYVEKSNFTIASANYILDYSAALNKNNFYAVQFHPEKSGDVGQNIIKNFLTL